MAGGAGPYPSIRATRTWPDHMTALALDLLQLAAIKNALIARIELGLAKDGEEIKALPAFLAPPVEGLVGRALAIDTGGTNLRAAVVEVSPNATKVIEGPIGASVPDGRDGTPVDRAAFFGVHAEVVAKLSQARGLPIGFCFSYPSAVEPSRDARLIAWTKGIDVHGVVGTLVGAGLVEALEKKGLAPGKVTVLNDTVASLLAASSLTPASSRTIGLIVGTGHNIASFFAGERITKLPGAHGTMAVNLESGNFHPPFLSTFDDAVDARSGNPGRQRMEKAVSGYYLPQIFAAAMPDRAHEPAAQSAKALHDLAYGGGSGPDVDLARALFERSADLVAAALAAVGTFHSPEGLPITVLGEGSVYRSDPRYAARIEAKLSILAGAGRFRLVSAPDANLSGSAWAALG